MVAKYDYNPNEECVDRALEISKDTLADNGGFIDRSAENFMNKYYPDVLDGDYPNLDTEHENYGHAITDMLGYLYSNAGNTIESFKYNKFYIEEICHQDSENVYKLSEPVMIATGIPEFDIVMRLVMSLGFIGVISFSMIAKFRLNNLFKIIR